jgi:hypothetical protein
MPEFRSAVERVLDSLGLSHLIPEARWGYDYVMVLTHAGSRLSSWLQFAPTGVWGEMFVSGGISVFLNAPEEAQTIPTVVFETSGFRMRLVPPGGNPDTVEYQDDQFMVGEVAKVVNALKCFREVGRTPSH